MLSTQNKRIMALLCLTLPLLALGACTVGPLEISLRGRMDNESPYTAQTVTAVFATNTAIAALRTATAISAPVMSTMPGIPVTATPASQVVFSDLRLVYSQDSFTLLNTSGRTRDIAGLSFHSPAGELSIDSWDNGYLTTSLYAFPTGDCLMAWGLGTETQAKPVECATRHSWIAVNSQQTFWQDSGSFGVRWYGQHIAECLVSATFCDIRLP